MSAVPSTKDIAERLLAGVTARTDELEFATNRTLQVCETLRVPLTKFAGAVGFASLFSRALMLAKRQVPLLQKLRVEADGTIKGFDEIPQDPRSLETLRQGGTVLIAELLGLLVTLIGEPLMLTIIRQAFPNVAIGITTENEEKS